MTLTQTLRDEHAIIQRALLALEGMACAAEKGQRVPASAVRNVVQFCRAFADALHHHHEEGLLFPALESAGLPRNAGPLACMLREHDTARSLIARIDALAVGLEQGHPQEVASFLTTARSYIHLLRLHMEKEDAVLFVMAEEVLGDVENTRLLSELHLKETAGRRQREIARVDALVERWVETAPKRAA